MGETKILELEEELRVVANNLKSLEVPSNLTTVFQLTIYSSGGWGEGEPEGEDLQGVDQDVDGQAEAGGGARWVCREVRDEVAEGGGEALWKLSFKFVEKIFPFQVDRLEDELVSEQEKYKAITEEVEQTFAEMSGY